MNIVKETRNEFLKRKEVMLVSTFASVPSYVSLQKTFAEKFKVVADVIAIKHVHSSFGTKQVSIEVYIYDSPEAFRALEVRNRRPKKEAGK